MRRARGVALRADAGPLPPSLARARRSYAEHEGADEGARAAVDGVPIDGLPTAIAVPVGAAGEAAASDAAGAEPAAEEDARALVERRKLAAGVVGAAGGLLLTGNMLCSALAGGAAAYATTMEGDVGAAARRVADGAAETYDKARAAMRERGVGGAARVAAGAARSAAVDVDDRLGLSARADVIKRDVARKVDGLRGARDASLVAADAAESGAAQPAASGAETAAGKMAAAV